ncbi:MAG: alpha/beta hydrolase [Brevinematales bacterium]|nr:alpha/beta hydrolase [Brevinematales bacterium]
MRIIILLLLFVNLHAYQHYKTAVQSNDVITISNYITTYNLDIKNVRHKFYFLYYQNTNRFFVHELIPPSPKGIVFFFHGYLSHSGLFWDFYKYMLDRNYQIVAADLPGHGLSDGDRTAIDDFSTYAEVVYETYLKIQKDGNGLPIYFVGHSTGCSAIYEFIYSYNVYPEKVVFVAPLVRIIFWEMASFGYNLFGNNIKTLPRLRRNTSQDRNYIDFLFNKDPIRYDYADVSWFKATLIWNERIANYSVITNVNLLIIQGDRDEVVEWRYNTTFLTNKFYHSDIYIIKDGRHDLLTERDDIKYAAFKEIEDFFKISHIK